MLMKVMGMYKLEERTSNFYKILYKIWQIIILIAHFIYVIPCAIDVYLRRDNIGEVSFNILTNSEFS